MVSSLLYTSVSRPLFRRDCLFWNSRPLALRFGRLKALLVSTGRAKFECLSSPSEIFAQGAGEFTQCRLIAPVPHPLPDFLGIYQSGLVKDGHMMRNCWLG